MTATDELRRLLDERGIFWQDKTNDGDRCEILPGDSVTWWFDHNDVLSAARENFGHKLALRCECTPTQAVEMTLGRGECQDLGGTGANDEQVFNCSECGCVLSLYDRDGSNNLCTSFISDYPRYCPECGRKVVDE